MKETDRPILVVDDNEINREVINMQLSSLGYSVVTTADGMEALQSWRDNSYAMVLTDCHMPVMNGFELAEAIRKAENGNDTHTIIVALTANTIDEERDRCINSGMDDCLSKPIDLEVLDRALSKWILSLATKAEADK